MLQRFFNGGEAAALAWIHPATLIVATDWLLSEEEAISKYHPIRGQEHRKD